MCKHKDRGSEECASISGDIDHHSAREMRLRIDTAFAVSDARELILDMSGVKFMDSSGLGLILGRFTKASAQGSVVRRDKSERVGEARA